MKTAILKTYHMISFILLAAAMLLLFLLVMRSAGPLLTSVGWHQVASVSWNG